MLPLRLDPGALERGLTVLALGAHSDDIEIGCGGTILRLAELAPSAHVHWAVLSGDEERAREARASAADFLAGFTSSEVVVERFRDGFFSAHSAQVKDWFEELKGLVSPDLVLTHAGSDLHQDHRLVSELTWNTFRDHLILEYEVPKYDGDIGRPGFYVHVDEQIVRRKTAALHEHFASQRANQWFTEDVFRAMLRLRGMESNAPSGFAEAFYCRKVVI